MLLSSFGLVEGLCGDCGQELVGGFSSSMEPNDPRASLPLVEFGFPLSEIITIRFQSERVHYGIQGV